MVIHGNFLIEIKVRLSFPYMNMCGFFLSLSAWVSVYVCLYQIEVIVRFTMMWFEANEPMLKHVQIHNVYTQLPLVQYFITSKLSTE